MRIISGELKGKSINYLKNSNTRPLKDSVRENIFNILKHSFSIKVKVENSNILDLYSGIGSFGIESLSRYAKKVTFIEQNLEASNLLKDNLVALSIAKKALIFNDKIEHILNHGINEKFDIFFLDPPFADLNYLKILSLIRKNKIFKSKHIVVIHRERKSKDDYKSLIRIIKTKQYGRSKIIFAEFI